jgi:sulfatase maturation enzyme AslB (radical SAM superfamily)
MANKFILVPEEIYKGLTSHNTDEPNIDFVRKRVEKTKRKKENINAKNINYNQELRRYLKMWNEQKNRPVKVEMISNSKGSLVRPTTSLSNGDYDDTTTVEHKLSSLYETPNASKNKTSILEEKPDIKSPLIASTPKTIKKHKVLTKRPLGKTLDRNISKRKPKPVIRFSPNLWNK